MSLRDVVLRGTIAASFCVLSSLTATAQGVGAIGGTITDASGAILPGVVVALSNTLVPSVAIRRAVTTIGARSSSSGWCRAPIACAPTCRGFARPFRETRHRRRRR